MNEAFEPLKFTKPTENDSLSITAKKYYTSGGPLHWHNFYEIELVISGEGTHWVNGAEYEWKTGEMHFLRLTDFHEISLKGKGLLHLIQILPGHLPEDILKIINFNQKNLVVNLSDNDFSYADTLCLMLENELAKREKCNKKLVTHLLSVISILFSNALGAKNEQDCAHDNDLIAKIVIFIGENFRKELSLEQLAEHFSLSKNYLCYYFKKHMNTTILNHIKDLRLEFAANLAKNTKLKSIDIAKACGYGSISNFLRDFKKRYNMAPLDMRKIH